MDFDDNARLDTSRVSTSRGRGRGAAIGGGGLGIVGLLLALVLGVNPADLTGGGAAPAGPATTADLGSECRTGADADRDPRCRIVGLDNSLTDYWGSVLQEFRPATTEIFTGSVSTGCGEASSAVGPFYCPPDFGIYLDLGFFEELRTTYGARGGAVGDDRIQEASQGRVDPESWTHGSADQRQKWFRIGLRDGDPNDCDTFAVARV